MARDFVPASSEYLSLNAAVLNAFPISVSMSGKFDTVGINQAPMSLGDTDANIFVRMQLFTDAKLYVNARGSLAFGEAVNNTLVVAGEWTQLGALFASATNRRSVVNGVLGTANTTNVGSIAAVDNTRIGAFLVNSAPVTGFCDGDMGEVGIWNVALTTLEWAALGLGVSVLKIRRESLVGYWPIEGIDSPEPDLSGNKFNMTVNGTPLRSNHVPIAPYSSRFWGDGPLIEEAVAGGFFARRYYDEFLGGNAA